MAVVTLIVAWNPSVRARPQGCLRPANGSQETCYRFCFCKENQWAGVAWCEPGNDCGDPCLADTDCWTEIG